MPFTFIEIEERKTRVIALVFFSIIIFYFITVYLLLLTFENVFNLLYLFVRGFIFFPPPGHLLFALGTAFLAALLHWVVSTYNLIEKMSLAVNAKPIDPQDTYHQFLKNIVEEVSVATGGRHIEAMVIPSASLNAFSLEDFQKRAVIGVTEGLFSRLNRAQLEAVVGHEAAHITSGDSLITTVTCSLAEIHEETLCRVRQGLKNTSGRGWLPLALIYLVLVLMNFLSMLLRFFLSRQRELRADAVAVRLTRNPLALAEALKLISKNWRGAGMPGERMESIFIVNPVYDGLDEEEHFFADLFSTHPPIKKRVNTLLDMAHLDDQALEENLKNFKRASPVVEAEFGSQGLPEAISPRWLIFNQQNWLGPFSLDDLKKLENLQPDQWVKTEGGGRVIPAYEDVNLKKLFLKDREEKQPSCPNCKVPLQETNYEGVSILKCLFCAGSFVEQERIQRILIRQDKMFSPEITRLSESLIETKGREMLKDNYAKSVWVISCPRCQIAMRRQFFVYSYPVEIDRCISCSGIWFDRQELEILQYIYENKERFFPI